MKSLMLIEIDTGAVKSVLGLLKPEQQNRALKKALKATAEQARNRLAEQAQGSYTIKNAGFKKAMRIRAVSGNAPAAAIRSDGQPIPLKNFKISRGRRTTKAQVLKHGRLKELEFGGIRAFVNNIARRGQSRKGDTAKGKKGSTVRHIAVAQREGKKRLEIHEKFSSSIPAMLGSQKHVYGLMEPYIAEDLQENLKRFVAQALGE